MTKSSLKERLARLGPTRDVDRVLSGSPGDFVLRRGAGQIDVASASLVLFRHGLSLLKAKRTVEAVLDAGETRVSLPHVPSGLEVIQALKPNGVRAVRLAHSYKDLRSRLRDMRARMGLTQEQFALRFGFDLGTLKNWEQGHRGRKPDKAVLSYLAVIERDPEAAARAQEEIAEAD